ncbi:hypothetical protein C7R93_13405 [Brevibacillus fortis]|uniref:DUF3953 domain-containing protein n=1 Tax=Brevibacillus fortis TaxID=2126352 RepID=A0A2P7V721_9BACL|nr:hypothetical protein C7R93_13405 [Brevibacillus fortis]
MFLPIISILMSIWLFREAKLRNENKILWSILGLLFSFLAIGCFHLKHRNRIQGIVALIFGVLIYSITLKNYFS